MCDWMYSWEPIGDTPMAQVNQCQSEEPTVEFPNGGHYCPPHIAELHRWFEEHPDA